MEYNNESGTATLGTQVWKYRMRNMFDDFPAADYEHGKTADMEKKFNEIRAIYQRKGYRIKDAEITRDKVCEKGRWFTQVRKTFYVYDVPLKCLKGKKAKTLLVHLWINL